MLSKLTTFLLLSLAVLLSLLAAQCGAPPTPERIVEKVVETVIVEKEVEGEPVTVVETVEVEKEVVKEVVVTATPVPKPKVLVVAQNSDPLTLDPTISTGVETANANLHIFDGLVRMNAQMELEPMLATSWEALDPSTYKLNLRKGVKFHDGSDFTAEDVKFTIERILDEEVNSGLRTYIAYIDSVEIVDDYTVVLHCSQPFVTLMKQMARGVLIVPKNTFEKMGAEEFATNPVGTGPFKFVDWVKDQQLVLDANTDYWGGAPKVDRVIIRPIGEPSTRLAALLTGEVDIVPGLPLDQLDIVRASETARVETAEGLTQQFLALNTFKPPFDDIRVRRAVNYAIDKESILNNLLLGDGAINTDPYAPLSFGHNPDSEAYPYDPNQAKALLAEAGYPDGIDITLVYQTGSRISGADDLIVQAIAEQLRAVGIRTTLVPLERAEYVQVLLREGSMEHMALSSCRDALGDADFCIGLWYDPNRRSWYYNTPELTELIQEELSLVDPSERLKKLYEIGKYIYDDAGIGFLITPNLYFGVSSRVEGFEARGDRLLWVYTCSIKD